MALEEVPILNEVVVAAEAPARPAKRTKRDTGLNGGYWGSLSAPDDAADGAGAAEDAKYTRRRKASVPQVPFRTRSLFDDHSQQKSPKLLGRTLEKVHSGPNIYTVRCHLRSDLPSPASLTPRVPPQVDKFLTDGEVDHLLELIKQSKHRFGGSKTDQDDGIGLHDTNYRTSKTMHVKKGLDTTIRRIEARAAELVGMQTHNVEGLQVVSYTDGQKFETHHDIGPIDDACEHVVNVVPPRRIITLFVYLNDTPPGVGTTNFPLVKPDGPEGECLKVQPVRGRALMFCNVKVEDPSEPDDRVIHCATAVPSGMKKLGVNIWITDSNLAPCAL